MSKLLPKSDKVNISYPCKYNSIRKTFMYFINLPRNYALFEKCVRIKIKNHKIFILMSKRSPKLDKVNASYSCKYIIQFCETFMYFIVFHKFTT